MHLRGKPIQFFAPSDTKNSYSLFESQHSKLAKLPDMKLEWVYGYRSIIFKLHTSFSFLIWTILILGCGLWSGLDCEIKGFRLIMNNFRGQFFKFLWTKKLIQNFFGNILGSALKSCMKKDNQKLKKKWKVFLWGKNQLL